MSRYLPWLVAQPRRLGLEILLRRLDSLMPAIADANAKVVVNCTGLGDRVRLEAEELACEAGDRLIVHNYGHGGAGVTLSWGCAEEVRERVSAWLTARR